VKPGGTTNVGLDNVDFNKIKFMTIVSADEGFPVQKSGKVSGYKDLMIKVGRDLSSTVINSDEAKNLLAIAEGNPMEEGVCLGCKDKQEKAELVDYDAEMQCLNCGKEFQDIWVCKLYPTKHFFCKNCVRDVMVPRNRFNHKKRTCCGCF
jgi:hypothetical protein